MNNQRHFLHNLLSASGRAYASEIASRLDPWSSELGWPFQSVVQDTQTRLAVLGAALTVGVDEVFRCELEWSRLVHASRGLGDGYLRANVEAMQQVLAAELPQGHVEVEHCIRTGLLAFDDPVETVETLLTEDRPHVALCREYLLAVLEGDRNRAVQLVDRALDGGVTPIELLCDVIPLVQAEIGHMWARGEIHVAEEHLGSRLAEDMVVRIESRWGEAPACDGPRVLAASVSGDQHDIGLRIVSAVMRHEGWTTILLGANTPARDMLLSIESFQPDLLALSAHLAIHLPAAQEIIAQVQGDSELRVPVMVGGAAFRRTPALWRAVGADGFAATAREASAEAARLVRGQG